MTELLQNVEFWKAISAMLWPILALVVFISARRKIFAFLDKDNLSIKVAGMEISVADATKTLGTSVSDLQKRLADLESKIGSFQGDPRDKLESGEAVDLKFDEAASSAPISRTISILWVDDYPSNNAFLVEQFQNEGMYVKLALSTAQGVADFRNGEFDLIITDLGRKENGTQNWFAGLDLIQQIRALDRKIPILVFAGQRGIQNQDKLLRGGASKICQSAVEVQSFVNEIRGTTAAAQSITSETPRTSSRAPAH